MDDFYADKYKKCLVWIKEQIESNHSVDEIRRLCVSDSEFEDTLQDLVDDKYWPSFTQEKWEAFIDWYQKEYPKVQFSYSNYQVTGIPRNDSSRLLEPRTGYGSTWVEYKKMLENSIGVESAFFVEANSAWILNHLKSDTTDIDPIKGLVTGSVQSGKTANMAGLISMAADYDWNFFIILSGTIENLRKQTQNRFQSDLQSSEGISWKILDFSGEERGFSESELRLNSIGKKNFSTRYVVVCLKNKKRLSNLISWLYSYPNISQKLRMLVIDDEADQASINTAGITDAEIQERRGINQLIVNLVNGKEADGTTPAKPIQAINYISYTATPYANVLNEPPGESLYPKDFICTLPEPKSYFGAKVLFGNGEKKLTGFKVLRMISSAEEQQTKALNNGKHDVLPASMKDSIAWFLCASAIIRVRPHSKKKNISMLIHTSAKQGDHKRVFDAIRNWLSNTSDVLLWCKKVYAIEKTKVSKADLTTANPEYPNIDGVVETLEHFDDLTEEILSIVSDVRQIELDKDDKPVYGKGLHLCIDNCLANKYADEGTVLRIIYPDHKKEKFTFDPVFLVIGGNTLSRGLTIDGLVTTYFSRNSTQADTLMQMARWFGYRHGYELLQRIWLTDEVSAKFVAMTKIDMDMKEEIERFMKRGLSPETIGPRIRNIPSIRNFRITAKNKSQSAEYGDYDFSGDSYETTVFDDDDYLFSNNECAESFIRGLAHMSPYYSSSTKVKAYVWRKVPYKTVYEQMIAKYHFSDNSMLKMNVLSLCKWIDEMNASGKYLHWNVAVVDGADHSDLWKIQGNDIFVGRVERSPKKNLNYIDIGSLRSGKDALVDVDFEAIKSDSAKQQEFSRALSTGTGIIEARAKLDLQDTPLLLIYSVKKDGGKDSPDRRKMKAQTDIVGLSIIMGGVKDSHGYQSLRVKMPRTMEEE